MNVLDLEETRNSFLRTLTFLTRHDPCGIYQETILVIQTRIKKPFGSIREYEQLETQLEALNEKMGNPLKEYDPFDSESDSELEKEDQPWWDVEDTQEHHSKIRFAAFVEESDHTTKAIKDAKNCDKKRRFKSMSAIDKDLDLQQRIREQLTSKEISIELKEELLDFMEFCEELLSPTRREKWSMLREDVHSRSLSRLHQDFMGNVITHQMQSNLSEFMKFEPIEEDVIDELEEIDAKLDEVVDSTVLKLAVRYRLANPFLDPADEVKDLYELICSPTIRLHQKSILKLLLEEDVDDLLIV